MQGGSADGFGIIWESFDAAAVGKVKHGFLRLKRDACGKLMGKGGDACDDAFALAPS